MIQTHDTDMTDELIEVVPTIEIRNAIVYKN